MSSGHFTVRDKATGKLYRFTGTKLPTTTGSESGGNIVSSGDITSYICNSSDVTFQWSMLEDFITKYISFGNITPDGVDGGLKFISGVKYAVIMGDDVVIVDGTGNNTISFVTSELTADIMTIVCLDYDAVKNADSDNGLVMVTHDTRSGKEYCVAQYIAAS